MIKKGTRLIQLNQVLAHYQIYQFDQPDLESYSAIWRAWLASSKLKTLSGLDEFKYSDYTCGTSQTFDHFVIKHASKEIVALRGDFQYHACIARPNRFNYVDHEVKNGQALIVSFPFSDLGGEHPDFKSILHQCNQQQVPVCLDLAYWGIAKNLHIDLTQYPCITEITSSLTKPFFVLEKHRVGVRFTRDYQNDGISMMNEMKVQNTFSMGLGMHFMKEFSCDWLWQQLDTQYNTICLEQNLTPTDTVIFALGDEARYKDFNRGIKNNFRVCISDLFNV